MQCRKNILALLLCFISCFATNAAVCISTQIPKTYSDRFPIYFTHSDHLGSSTFTTDYYGNAVQFLHYLPYGELFANQRLSNNSYDERSKFVARTSQQHFGQGECKQFSYLKLFALPLPEIHR